MKKLILSFLCSVLLIVIHTSEAKDQFDVVIYGATPGGITSAVAAARENMPVLLIEPKQHVGGMYTSGLNTAESEHMLKWTYGGIALEFYQRLADVYGEDDPQFYFESHVAEKVYLDMLQEEQIEVRFGKRVLSTGKEGRAIKSIALDDGSTIQGNVFIDATYEGDLMARSGVSYTWGRENREKYNESLAGIRMEEDSISASPYDEDGNLLPGVSLTSGRLTPGEGDKKVMCYNYRLCFTKKKDNQVPFTKPDNYKPELYILLKNYLQSMQEQNKEVKFRMILDMYPRRNGKFEINNKQNAIISIGYFGGQFEYPDASYEKQDEIYQNHKDYTQGLLYFLQNDPSVPKSLRDEVAQWGLAKDEFTDNNNWPYYLYIREARRMIGEYVMTQDDILNSLTKADSIGMGSHFIDSHHVQRVAVSKEAFANEGRIWRIGRAYQIPYRCIIPKQDECTNLLVPVASSFSHVAFCTYRLESQWMMSGHSAGAAAALAVKDDIDVQEIGVKNLQQRLTEQGQIINYVEGKPKMFQGGPGHPEF